MRAAVCLRRTVRVASPRAVLPVRPAFALQARSQQRFKSRKAKTANVNTTSNSKGVNHGDVDAGDWSEGGPMAGELEIVLEALQVRLDRLQVARAGPAAVANIRVRVQPNGLSSSAPASSIPDAGSKKKKKKAKASKVKAKKSDSESDDEEDDLDDLDDDEDGENSDNIMPLNALASVAARESVLDITPFDALHAVAISRALAREVRDGSLQGGRIEGAASSGSLSNSPIRIILPKVTKEHRERLAAAARTELSTALDQSRDRRQKVMAKLKSAGLPKDDSHKAEQTIQRLIDASTKHLRAACDKKIAELTAA